MAITTKHSSVYEYAKDLAAEFENNSPKVWPASGYISCRMVRNERL